MNQRKNIAIVSIFTILFAGLLFAQERIAAPTVACPHPITRTLTAPPPSPPSLNAADFSGALGTAAHGSIWNQTKPDHGFGHSFKLPEPGKCCVWTKATLIVKVRALLPGGAGSPSSANDWVELVKNGASVPGTGQQPFSGGVTNVGQPATVTIAVPQNILNSGVVSFWVQDDSAVTAAELRLEGCCIN
jgi:hypothetical protein